MLEASADAELDTYHHLSSEEFWDGALHTSAFHFVLHIVQQLNKTPHQGQNNAHSVLSMASLFRHLMTPRIRILFKESNQAQSLLLKKGPKLFTVILIQVNGLEKYQVVLYLEKTQTTHHSAQLLHIVLHETVKGLPPLKNRQEAQKKHHGNATTKTIAIWVATREQVGPSETNRAINKWFNNSSIKQV